MSQRTDSLIRDISIALVPGQPLLVTGNRGCGKVEMLKRAFKKLDLPEKYVNCSVLELVDFHGSMFDAGCLPKSAIVLDEIDRLEDEELIGQVRHFMSLSSRTIVLVANEPERIHSDILAQVSRRVNVPDATDDDIREWIQSRKKA